MALLRSLIANQLKKRTTGNHRHFTVVRKKGKGTPNTQSRWASWRKKIQTKLETCPSRKDKPWTIRLTGILSRQHRQADIENFNLLILRWFHWKKSNYILHKYNELVKRVYVTWTILRTNDGKVAFDIYQVIPLWKMSTCANKAGFIAVIWRHLFDYFNKARHCARNIIG